MVRRNAAYVSHFPIKFLRTDVWISLHLCELFLAYLLSCIMLQLSRLTHRFSSHRFTLPIIVACCKLSAEPSRYDGSICGIESKPISIVRTLLKLSENKVQILNTDYKRFYPKYEFHRQQLYIGITISRFNVKRLTRGNNSHYYSPCFSVHKSPRCQRSRFRINSYARTVSICHRIARTPHG